MQALNERPEISSNDHLRHCRQMFADSGQRLFFADLEVDVDELVGEGGELVGEAGAVLARDVGGPGVRIVLERKKKSAFIWKERPSKRPSFPRHQQVMHWKKLISIHIPMC